MISHISIYGAKDLLDSDLGGKALYSVNEHAGTWIMK